LGEHLFDGGDGAGFEEGGGEGVVEVRGHWGCGGEGAWEVGCADFGRVLRHGIVAEESDGFWVNNPEYAPAW
jgi:hypothetical protein